MKLLVLLLVWLILPATLMAQYPANNPVYPQNKPNTQVERAMNNLPIISETRSFIEEAMGWTLQDDGKWISAKNRIPFNKAEYNKSGKTSYKLGKENFELIELRDVNYDNGMYVVLIMKFKTGYYEFPILMDGWHNQQGLSYFVFRSEKLKEVIPDKMEFNKTYITNMEVVCSGSITGFNKNTLNSTIAYNIQKTLSDKTLAPRNLLIAFWPVQTGGQSLARFRLIQVMNKKKFYVPYLELGNRNKLFKGSYYETDYNIFQGFIRYGGALPVTSFAGNPQTTDDYYKRGVSNYGMGNYIQAISDLTEAAKTTPYSDFFLTYSYRGNSRQKMGDFAGALQDFDRAVMLRPADQGYYSAWLTTLYNRGVARQNLKDNNGACQDWNTAVQLGFKDLETDNAIKEYCKNYRFTGSTLNYATTPSSIPNSPSPESQTDYYKVYWDGVWKYENGNFTEALRFFNRALELKPQSNVSGIYFYRGNCKLKLNDYQGAIQDFDYAVAFSASQPTDNSTLKTLYYNRGLANFFLGNISIACSDFQKSLNAGMNDPQSLNFMKQVCK